MTFQVNLNKKITDWNDDDVKNKLIGLSISHTGEKTTWIKTDLTISSPGKLKQALFFILGKIKLIRESCFHIDPKESSSVLNQLRTQIEGSHDIGLINLFNKAVQNIKKINNKIDVPTILEAQSAPSTSQIPAENESSEEKKEFDALLSGAYGKLEQYSFLRGEPSPYPVLSLKDLSEKSKKCHQILLGEQLNFQGEENPNIVFISWRDPSLGITSPGDVAKNELVQILCYMLLKNEIAGFSEILGDRSISVALNEQGVNSGERKYFTKEMLLT